MQRRTPDRRAGESTYIVAATTLAAVLLVSQFLTWAYLHPLVAPGSFLAAQLVAAAAYAGVALIGRQPAQHVHVTDRGLRMERGAATLAVPYSEIRHVSTISAAAYYGHFARFAATQAFVNRMHGTLLMLDVASRPVILGLDPADLVEMERILSERTAASYSSPRVGAA